MHMAARVPWAGDWYERGDSNPYDQSDLRILSPLRLPIPPRSRRRLSNTYGGSLPTGGGGCRRQAAGDSVRVRF